MIEFLLNFLAEVIFQTILGLPALPRDSYEWKKRRKAFIRWLIGAFVIVGIIALFTILNAYGVV